MKKLTKPVQSIYREFKVRPEISRSIVFLTLEKMIRLLVGFYTYVIIVNYLGPNEFGRFSYIFNLTSLFLPLVVFGMEEILTRDFVHTKSDDEKSAEIFYSALVVKFANAVLALISTLVVIKVMKPDDKLVFELALIYVITLMFATGEIGDIYLQSHLDVKKMSLGRNAGYLASVAARIFGVNAKLSFPWIMAASASENIFSRLFVLALNFKTFLKLKFKISKKLVSHYYRECLPLFLTIFFFGINDRVGMIFLDAFHGNASVGALGLGFGLLETGLIVPFVLSNSLYPSIVRSKLSLNKIDYEKKLQIFSDILVWAGVGVAICATLLGPTILSFLFGNKFSAAIHVIQLGSWLQIFVYFNFVRYRFMTLEKGLKALFYVTFTTLILNCIFQYLLVPSLKEVGTCLAMLISNSLGLLVVSLFFKETTLTVRLFIKSLILPYRLIKRA